MVCIDEEIPFEIPAGWEWCRLNNLLSVISDGTHKTPNYTESGVPFLSVQNISSGRLDLSKIKYISLSEHKKLIERVHPQRDDILICRIGTLGKALKITWDFDFSIFVSLGLLRPVLPEIADYLVSYINSPAGFRWIQENKVGGGTHTFKINLGDFPNMLVCIPPHEEQKRIEDYVSTIEPLLRAYTGAQEKLDNLNNSIKDSLKKSILQEAIQGKLIPQEPNDESASALLENIAAEKQHLVKEGKLKAKDAVASVIFKGEDNKYYEKIVSKVLDINEEIPFKIPKGWVWSRLDSLFAHNTEKALNRADQEGRLFSYITTSNLYWNRFELDDLRKMYFNDSELEKCTVIKGDLLVCEGGDIGRSAIWPYDEEIRIQNHIHRLRPYIPVNVQFYYYNMLYLKLTGMIGGKGIGIQGLSSKALGNILLPVPPLAEQEKIAQKIQELFAAIR